MQHQQDAVQAGRLASGIPKVHEHVTSFEVIECVNQTSLQLLMYASRYGPIIGHVYN